VGSTALLSDFDSVFRRQKEIEADEFNEDNEYKHMLNEVISNTPDDSAFSTN
jgi:hypothetical protein